jgi:soluble lytic murein transglycosylase
MRHPIRLLPALLAGLALGAPLGASAQTTAQASLLAQALDAAATGDWTEAETRAAWTGSAIARDIVLWTRLRDGAGTWAEYAAFLARNPDWPGLETLRRAGERQMPKGLPPQEVIAYFA